MREQGKGASLFGHTSLYGSVPGGQAEFLRVPQRFRNEEDGCIKVVLKP